jgi:hypothetical protein
VNAGKGFPSDFYITCATVLPILYLALVVQGPTYEDMLKRAMEAAHTQRRRAALRPLTNAYLAVSAGLVGEAVAIVVLFIGSDMEIIRLGVLITTLSMLFATGAGPTFRWLGAMRKVTRELRSIRRPDLSEDDHDVS